MTDYRAIYSECISDLHDKKQHLRESAASKLIPHLTQNDAIHDYIQTLSDALLTASEKGLNPIIFSQAFCRIAAIDPTLNSYATVFSIIIKHLKQSRHEPEHYTQLFASLGFILCMVNTFNEIFDDLSDIFYLMVDSVTTILTTDSNSFLPYAARLVYGLNVAYSSLLDEHKSGWAYDRYVPLMIYFLTRNPSIEVSMKTIPYITSGLLSAAQAHKLDVGGIVPGAYPQMFCQQYQLHTDLDHDDGYYTLDGEDSVYIPLIHYEFDHLERRIKMIFDRSSISLDNDYSEQELEVIRENLDDVFKFLQTNSVSDSDIADNLATHQYHDIVPDRYSTIQGRAVYHGLEPHLGLSWEDVSFMPFMGEVLSAVEILANLEPKVKEDVDKRTRRLTKKQRDIEQNRSRQMKYAYLFSDE